MPSKPETVARQPHWIVVGGGLGGIVAAYFLAKSGKPTILVEQGPRIGGVNTSHSWNGFTLDWGCHLFGNEDDRATSAFLDLLNREFVPVVPKVASYAQGRLTRDTEYPDITSYGKDMAAASLYELVERAAAADDMIAPRTLAEALGRRFGDSAAAILDSAFRKMVCEGTDALAPAAAGALPANRIRLMDDVAADLLKKVPALDDRILRTSGDDPMRYHRTRAKRHPFRAFYPATGGMGGFSSRAHARLQALGCSVITNSGISALEPRRGTVTLADGKRIVAEHVVWAAGAKALGNLLGIPTPVEDGTHVVSMLLYYFAVASDHVGPYSYIHDFDQTAPAFRISVPSSYAPKVCPPGLGYVCAEVSTRQDSAGWADPESLVDRTWAQVLDRGVAMHARQPVGRLVKKVPVTYRLPRPSLPQIMEPLVTQVSRFPRLRLLDEWVFSKTSQVRHVLDRCADMLK